MEATSAILSHFGNDAWQIQIKDLPYLKVGPYHTNTVAGLSLAMDILRKRKNPNKQIMMITDGKPTCLKIGKKKLEYNFGGKKLGIIVEMFSDDIKNIARRRSFDLPFGNFFSNRRKEIIFH